MRIEKIEENGQVVERMIEKCPCCGRDRPTAKVIRVGWDVFTDLKQAASVRRSALGAEITPKRFCTEMFSAAWPLLVVVLVIIGGALVPIESEIFFKLGAMSFAVSILAFIYTIFRQMKKSHARYEKIHQEYASRFQKYGLNADTTQLGPVMGRAWGKEIVIA